MAKGGRTLNPADAQRKAERKKEVNKNKANRQKAREITTVKKSTKEYESEIGTLEEQSAAGSLDKNGRDKLTSLKKEVERINKAKEEYVEAHPEHAKLVHITGRGTSKASSGAASSSVAGERPAVVSRSLFGKNGLPLHPERSIYYDAVMNPFGVAPPGMPYLERPLLPHEMPHEEAAPPTGAESSQEDDSDEESIPLPSGPPPLPPDSDDDSDSSDIPMPEGPPPGALPPPLLIGTLSSIPPPPPGGPPPILEGPHPPPPPGGALLVSGGIVAIPPPPLGGPPTFSQSAIPSPSPFAANYDFIPPPPFSIPPLPPYPQQFIPPPPPPGGPSVRQPRVLHDPLSTTPQQSYQAHREMVRQQATISTTGGTPRLPSTAPPPPPFQGSRVQQKQAVAVIEAQPELRDLKRESTAFVPGAVKRRKVATGAVGLPGQSSTPTSATQQIMARVNAANTSSAAGGTNTRDAHSEQDHRPDLMNALRKAGVSAPVLPSAKPPNGKPGSSSEPADDYKNFLDEMGDILH